MFLDGTSRSLADDDYTATTPGWGVDHFASIQDGIDAGRSRRHGQRLPRNLQRDPAASRYLYNNAAFYQFGLFFADEKPGVTVTGPQGDGSPITAYADVAATVTTNAHEQLYSGVFVEADNTTIAGLRIGPNAPSDNKTIEVIGENFTLKNSVIDVSGGGSVYINDWRYDDGTDTSYCHEVHRRRQLAQVRRHAWTSPAALV